MILYDNKANSIFLILRRKGSIIWTILIEIFMAVGFALLFVLYQPILLPNFDRRSITNPFALQVSLIITGYQVVFRTNMALWRFWEGCTQVTTMTSRWTQSFSQTRAFLLGSAATAPGTREERLIVTRILRDALRRCATYFTVMHGLAVLELEGNELEHGEEAHWDIVPFEEPESQYKKLCKTPGGSFEWVGEPPREYRRSKKPPPLSILGEVTENDAMDLDGTKDNVLMAGMWITEEVSSLVLKGQCRVPPPIISRCYQELSNGMLGFNQALKIKLVPFPFVLAQIASLNLLVVLCGSPMFVHIFTGSPFFTLLFTGIIVLGYYGLNRISIELEDPYGTDENDLPMRSMQLDFCHRLRQSAEMDLPHVEGLELGLIERPSDEQFDEAKRTHRLSLLPPMFDADDAEKLAAAARSSRAGSRPTSRPGSRPRRRRFGASSTRSRGGRSASAWTRRRSRASRRARKRSSSGRCRRSARTTPGPGATSPRSFPKSSCCSSRPPWRSSATPAGSRTSTARGSRSWTRSRPWSGASTHDRRAATWTSKPRPRTCAGS